MVDNMALPEALFFFAKEYMFNLFKGWDYISNNIQAHLIDFSLNVNCLRRHDDSPGYAGKLGGRGSVKAV